MTLKHYVFTCVLFAHAFPNARKTWVVLATGMRIGAAHNRLYFMMVDIDDEKVEVLDEIVLPLTHLELPDNFELSSWGDITARLDIKESSEIFITIDDTAGTDPDAVEIYDITLPEKRKALSDEKEESDVQN